MKNSQGELHVWLDDPTWTFNACTSYSRTKDFLDMNEKIIHTTQTHFCSFRYQKKSLYM